MLHESKLALGAVLSLGLVLGAEAKVDVMCVYYPHWHRYPKGDEWFGAENWKQGEWAYVKTAKPRFPGHNQPLGPYGGFRDESDPKQMAVDIALAANAGIDVFLYDYYYYNGEITQEDALEKGFLGADNRSRMKFALMWCYHERNNQFRPKSGEPRVPLMSLAHTPEEFLGLIDLSVARYFHRPEYYRKDGKLFFSIYNAPYFLKCVGTNEVKAAIAEVRRRIRAAGLGELHLNAQNARAAQSAVLKDVGFDSLTHYGNDPWRVEGFYRKFVEEKERIFDYSWVVEGAHRTWAEMRAAELPYIPSVLTGWDSTPRCRDDEPFPWKNRDYPYVYTLTNNTPDAVQAHLAAAKAYAESDPRQPGIVYINGWNEYTEGSFLIPNNFMADGFLRAVASVFGRKPANEYTYINPSTGKLYTIPSATHENVSYGPHSKQKLDVWLPKGASGKTPLIVYLHGGGWADGAIVDGLFGPRIEQVLKKGVAVACVGYRYLRDTERQAGSPPVKGCIDDVVSAVRFLKDHAAEWNIDDAHIGLAGGSAGACSAMIVAYRNDNALGISALAPVMPQTSMDPAEMRSWIPNIAYGANAFGYRGFDDWLARRNEHPEWIADYSPAALARRIDPARAPLVILRAARPKAGELPKDPTHADAFSWKFAEICDARGLPCDLQEHGNPFDALADALVLANASAVRACDAPTKRCLSVELDRPSGGLAAIRIAGDETGMNWIHRADGRTFAWVGPDLAWGTGTLKIDGRGAAWNRPDSVTDVETVYRPAPELEVRCERSVADGELTERYCFRNVSQRTLSLSEIDIHTPFHDDYLPHGELLTKRCHAHVWAGGATAWVCALRMGGKGPHLGLSVIDGDVSAYELKCRGRETGSSDFRGVIALSPHDRALPPGKMFCVAWRVFAHDGKPAFLDRVRNLGGVVAACEDWVVTEREPATVVFTAASPDLLDGAEIRCEGVHVASRREKNRLVATCRYCRDGEFRVLCRMRDGRSTWAEILARKDPNELMQARVRFLLSRQVVEGKGPEDQYDGALVPYDNELERQYRRWEEPEAARRSLNHSEGRERLSMGVFLAKFAQLGARENGQVRPLLDRYARFVRHGLQDEDHTVWGTVGRGVRQRLFDYPWAAEYYLEYAKATGRKEFFAEAGRTLLKCYGRIGAQVLVESPERETVERLRDAGYADLADTLVAAFREQRDGWMKTGFVTDEVGFAPEMAAGYVSQFLAVWKLTGEDKYRRFALDEGVPFLEACMGPQPSWHSHDIGLHHWDGYWFGKRACWGDTLPHGWNGTAADAFSAVAEATGDDTYRRRARAIVRQLLGLYGSDGRAGCAWVLPDRVNGRPARFLDPLANDQDWALLFYLRNSERDAPRQSPVNAFGVMLPRTNQRKGRG